MKDRDRKAVDRAVSLLKFFTDGCSCTRDTHPCPRCMARDFIKEFDGEAAPKKKEHNCLNCETAKKPGWKGNCGTCPPLEDSGVRPRVREDASRALLTDAIKEVDRLRAEVARLTEISIHGCDCSQEDACKFARERDEARVENENLTKAINDRGACMCGFLRIECKSHAAIRQERDEARAENEKMKAEAKDHKAVAVMLSTENERLQEENAKLRADFPPAPPLPVHECKCYACEYLRRKQKEDRDKQEKK